jgi:hypothetical protein
MAAAVKLIEATLAPAELAAGCQDLGADSTFADVASKSS